MRQFVVNQRGGRRHGRGSQITAHVSKVTDSKANCVCIKVDSSYHQHHRHHNRLHKFWIVFLRCKNT